MNKYVERKGKREKEKQKRENRYTKLNRAR